jgi:co-chaperonin GroES (HSP10)
MLDPERFKGVGDKVLVKTDPRPTMEGSLHLPQHTREKMRTATILSQPKPHWRGRQWVVPDPAVRPGARVLLTKFSVKSEDYSDDGIKMVVRYEDIGAVEE